MYHQSKWTKPLSATLVAPLRCHNKTLFLERSLCICNMRKPIWCMTTLQKHEAGKTPILPNLSATAPSLLLDELAESYNLPISMILSVTACFNEVRPLYLFRLSHNFFIQPATCLLRQSFPSILELTLQKSTSFSHAHHPGPYLLASTVERWVKNLPLQRQ